MIQPDERIKQAVRQANGLSPGFRYFDDPYKGQTIACPFCDKTIAAGLETCPECDNPIPGHQHSREHIRTSPGVILLICLLIAVFGLCLYFFVQEMLTSGFIALLLEQQQTSTRI